MIEIKNAVLKDCEELAANLRLEDKAELLAMGSADTLTAIVNEFKSSEVCRSMFYKGRLAAMFGVSPKDFNLGCAWALTTTVVEDCKLSFIKETKKFTAECLEKYEGIYNGVDARYGRAIRWIQGFGGVIVAPIYIGPNKFYIWHLRRK